MSNKALKCIELDVAQVDREQERRDLIENCVNLDYLSALEADVGIGETFLSGIFLRGNN